MRILFFCRLMGCFESSLRTRSWNPSGSPAIRYLIEALDKDPDIDLTLIMARSYISEEDDQRVKELANQTCHIDGLNTPVSIFASASGPLKRIKYYVREIRHLIKLYQWTSYTKPDLIYMDRGNILLAAAFARFSKIPVVWRLLGVPLSLQPVLTGRRPFELLLRYAFRSPFAHVICTQDGSGGLAWMAKALDPKTPRSHWLNGVNFPEKDLPKKTENKIILTFLGRLEIIKGCDFFIEAALLLPETYQQKIKIFVVGDGELFVTLKQKVRKASADRFIHLTGALKHEDAQNILAQTDLYACLNRQGHTSNATLEAITHGCGLIIQRNVPDHESDEEFESIIPKSDVAAISQTATPKMLAEKIISLVDHPQEIKRLQDQSRKIAKEKFRQWPERIHQEVQLLKSIGEAHRP